MYQTVGHQVVEAYAQCMDLPLFRIYTSGQSSHKASWSSLLCTRFAMCVRHTQDQRNAQNRGEARTHVLSLAKLQVSTLTCGARCLSCMDPVV